MTRTVDAAHQPALFPTHMHDKQFWECLGRAVATYGFLEDVLGRAIFAFSSRQLVPIEHVDKAMENWLPVMENALKDTLHPLITTFESLVRKHNCNRIGNFDTLLSDLRNSVEIRNVLCHGSWEKPDYHGASLPRFVDRKLRVFQTSVDLEFLRNVQCHVAELAAAVISAVTIQGWDFPGSSQS